VSEPILLVLAFWPFVLLLLALATHVLPALAVRVSTAVLTATALLLCLFTAIVPLQPSGLALPIGPPGLSVHLALDALSAFFLIVALVSATALAVFEIGATAGRASPRVPVGIAGAVLTLLAADATLLAIGLALSCSAGWIDRRRRRSAVMFVPFAVLAAVALMTPSGFPPHFDAIRAAPATLMNPTFSVLLTLSAVIGLIAIVSLDHAPIRDGLTVGLVLPIALYLLLRLVVELPGASAQSVWGVVLMSLGSALAIWFGWQAASAREIDAIAAGLARCQVALALIGGGIVIESRLTDLPTASGNALAALFLIAIGCVAALAVTLAVHMMAASTGTYRLSRLGGLIHLMPASSGALCGALLGAVALPPSLGFASIWLLLRAIVSAPRTGGLVSHLVLAAGAAAIALTALLQTTACLRLVGVAVLGRPRSPQGAGARDFGGARLNTLYALAGLTAIIGLLPGAALDLLVNPVLQALTELQAGTRAGPFGTGPGYLALPIAALIGFFVAAATLARRRGHGYRIAPPWHDGASAPPGLPFGEPRAQISGDSFLPRLPPLLSRVRRLAEREPLRRPRSWAVSPSHAGFWVLLAVAASVLATLALGSIAG
jgi:hydrogenase-4 component B